MHGKVSTPNTHSRSGSLEPFLQIIINVTLVEYSKRLLFIYICRAYTYKRKAAQKMNVDMDLEQTSSQSDLQ